MELETNPRVLAQNVVAVALFRLGPTRPATLQLNLIHVELEQQLVGVDAAAVGAQKMLYELLLRRKLDHEAAKASRPGWGYRHSNTR